MSESALGGLMLERVRELVPDVEELSFVEAAKSPDQARAWVERYWEKMRPKFRPVADTNQVFTSALTRRGFRHSAVSHRFHKVVDAAFLQRSISNYECWML